MKAIMSLVNDGVRVASLDQMVEIKLNGFDC